MVNLMHVASSLALRFPRLNELRTCICDPKNPDAFFQNFDQSLRDCPQKRKQFSQLEAILETLDDDAWKDLKTEAVPYLTQRDLTRGWEQLLNILNQANGYNYLKQRGCSDVHFIARVPNKKTPDLRAHDGTSPVLCEVKTLNISKNEADRRTSGGVGTTVLRLPQGVFYKLQSDIDIAIDQMRNYDSTGKAKMIFYCVVNFDDHLHECADNYHRQLDDYVKANVDPSLEVVFDIKPPFYSAV
jgi:hypothetical protein